METLIRRPLQQRNFDCIPASQAPLKKPKKLNPEIVKAPPLIQQEITKKETPQIELDVKKVQNSELIREVSLAEELSIARKKKERLRAERLKTEALLEERDLVLKRAMKEMERRAEEQSNIELEIYKFVLLKDLKSSSMMVHPLQSLREKEEEKKKRKEAEAHSEYSVNSLRAKEQEKNLAEKSKESITCHELDSEVSLCSQIQEEKAAMK